MKIIRKERSLIPFTEAIRKLITMENQEKFSWQWHYKED